MTKSTGKLENDMSVELNALDLELRKNAKTHQIDLNYSEKDFLAFLKTNTNDWNLNRLNNLNNALQQVIQSKEEESKKTQDVQTMQAKISNLAKQFKIPYHEVIEMLNNNRIQD